MNQQCNTCNLILPLEDFQKDITRKFGRTHKCKKCLSIYNSGRKKENKEKRRKNYLKSKEYYHKKRLHREYGLSKEQYKLLFDSQKGLCKICSNPEKLKNRVQGTPLRLAIDHCHNTGLIRGLLCAQCNVGLGNFKDNIELLEKAITYLKGKL